MNFKYTPGCFKVVVEDEMDSYYYRAVVAGYYKINNDVRQLSKGQIIIVDIPRKSPIQPDVKYLGKELKK